MVVDELFVKKGSEFLPIDSLDNQMIDEIVYEGESYHFAKQKDLTGTSKIEADNGVDEPIISLGVTGNTVQDGTPTPELPIPIQNTNDNGMSIVLHGTNLATARDMYSKKSGATFVDVLDEATGEIRHCARFMCTTLKYTIQGGFKENTQYTVSFVRASAPESTSNPQPFCFWYTDGTFQMVGWKSSTDYTFTKATAKSEAGKTVQYIGIYNWNSKAFAYVDVNTFILQEGAITDPVYEPYFREEITIPESIDVSGTNVPLVLAKYVSARPQSYPTILYDTITVDKLSNKVVFRAYTVKYAITGNESSWYSSLSGHIMAYASNLIGIQMTTPYGYCNQFTLEHFTGALKDYRFANSTVIIFKLPNSPTVEEYKAFFQQQYENGTPVELQLPRKTPIEYDLTNTDLGQQLLALATHKGTNYLEITSNLEPTQTDLSYWRQVIPNE